MRLRWFVGERLPGRFRTGEIGMTADKKAASISAIGVAGATSLCITTGL